MHCALHARDSRGGFTAQLVASRRAERLASVAFVAPIGSRAPMTRVRLCGACGAVGSGRWRKVGESRLWLGRMDSCSAGGVLAVPGRRWRRRIRLASRAEQQKRSRVRLPVSAMRAASRDQVPIDDEYRDTNQKKNKDDYPCSCHLTPRPERMRDAQLLPMHGSCAKSRACAVFFVPVEVKAVPATERTLFAALTVRAHAAQDG